MPESEPRLDLPDFGSAGNCLRDRPVQARRRSPGRTDPRHDRPPLDAALSRQQRGSQEEDPEKNPLFFAEIESHTAIAPPFR